MSIRHAAALVLVGWYLIVPPRYHDKIDTSAPMPLWGTAHVYGSAAECRENLQRNSEEAKRETKDARLRDMHREQLKLKLSPEEYAALSEQFINGKCIASDDPRLKEK